eukprot:11381629-Alexandrium_andersonii.AAC.1
MAPGVRRLNCAGPGPASTSLPEALEGWTKRPGQSAGGVFALCLKQLRHRTTPSLPGGPRSHLLSKYSLEWRL